MKYYPRLGIYKNSTGTNYFNPTTLTATSYNWWLYLKRINGLLVFNNYSYSPSTWKHQYALRSLLCHLNIPIDLKIEAPGGLQNLDSALSLYEKRIRAINLKLQNTRRKKDLDDERYRELLELDGIYFTLTRWTSESI